MFFALLFIVFQQSVTTETLKEGSGVSASAGTTLTVHYKGYLENGKEFDNSYKKGRPYPVTLEQSSVIQGWHIGLRGIKKGEIRKLIIPAKYGYGNRPRPNIPANSTLIFEVEVVDLVEPDRGWELTPQHTKVNLDSLHYYVIEEGSGEGAKLGDRIHYHYDLFDQRGLKIFSTKQNRKMEKLQLGKSKHMFKGFEHAILGMKMRGKRKIVVKTPFTEETGFYTFDVELIKIK